MDRIPIFCYYLRPFPDDRRDCVGLQFSFDPDVVTAVREALRRHRGGVTGGWLPWAKLWFVGVPAWYRVRDALAGYVLPGRDASIEFVPDTSIPPHVLAAYLAQWPGATAADIEATPGSPKLDAPRPAPPPPRPKATYTDHRSAPPPPRPSAPPPRPRVVLQTLRLGPDLIKALALMGLGWPTTPDCVRASYRRMAKLVHPDVGGSHEAFVALGDAQDLCLKQMHRGPEMTEQEFD